MALKIDLHHLAAFVAACSGTQMARFAAALGLKLSAEKGGIACRCLRAAGFRSSVGLLLAEVFLRRRVVSRGEGDIRTIVVEIDAAFSGAVLSQVTIDAIRTVNEIQSECFVDLIFRDNGALGLPVVASAELTTIQIVPTCSNRRPGGIVGRACRDQAGAGHASRVDPPDRRDGPPLATGDDLPASVVLTELGAGIVTAFPLSHIVPSRRPGRSSRSKPLIELEDVCSGTSDRVCDHPLTSDALAGMINSIRKGGVG